MFADITIIGLGRTFSPKLDHNLWKYINSDLNIYFKWSQHRKILPHSDSAQCISPSIDSFTGLANGYHTIAQTLLENTPCIFFVPGDPLVDEGSTIVVQQIADEAGVAVDIIHNDDLLSHILKRFGISPAHGLQVIDSTMLCSYNHPPLEPDRPAIITGLYDPHILPILKQRLYAIYTPPTKIRGIVENDVISTTLNDLDETVHQIFIPPQANTTGFTTFQDTIAHLYAPDGCPWDKEQTHYSLRQYLLEETYEALATIDGGQEEDLADELGDILLQILLHAQIASQTGTFRMADVIHKVNHKMIRRHPHVFGDVSVSGADEVWDNWQDIKAQEKAGKEEKYTETSILDGIKFAMPALAQTLEISQKAGKIGFEWENIEDVLDKLIEEAREIISAKTEREVESEIGDFLFSFVNIARKLRIDPESALRSTNVRFVRRFKEMEKIARQERINLHKTDIDTWQVLWKQAKKIVSDLEKKT
ncbi:MAG: nucleoside triphosphate pyrophosphohydrolase [Anaerolineaceae bacterium 4572_78]|nr:MAG: nucleoside triphosphate pyrophosphohydrolase [Anaerolineaceae bacterium 4572_78]